MQRRVFVAGVAATGFVTVSGGAGRAQEAAGTATPVGGEATPRAGVESGYAPVNGLQMYYEIHGGPVAGQVPLLLLHGGFLSIATSFGLMLPVLTEGRQVIAVEQQGHGHTADIDRPLTFEQEADDTAAALDYVGIEQVDVFGYSDGGNVGLGLTIRHPELVRKLAFAGSNINNEGLVPGLYDFMSVMTPDQLGNELRVMYEAEAPNPEDWSVLVEKVKQQVIDLKGWTPEQLEGITAPAMVIMGMPTS